MAGTAAAGGGGPNLQRFIRHVAGWARVKALLDLGDEDGAIQIGQQLAAEKLGCGADAPPKIPSEDLDTMERLARIVAARSAR